MLSTVHLGKAIVSCKGLDAVRGLTDVSESFAQLKKTMLESATKGILAVDSSKFDKISFTEIGKISDVSMIVTDREPDERWKQVFSAAGVTCVYPGMSWQTEA